MLEKRKKLDDIILGCAVRTTIKQQRRHSLKLQSHFKGDKQFSSTVETNRNPEMNREGFKEEKGRWEQEPDTFVSPERNRWSMWMEKVGESESMRQEGESGEDVVNHINVDERLNFKIGSTVFSKEKVPLFRNDDEAERSKYCSKRRRDENSRVFIESKEKNCDQYTGRRRDPKRKSEIKEINHASVGETATCVEKIVRGYQLKTFGVDALSESMESCRWRNQALIDRHGRYGNNRMHKDGRCVRDTSKEKMGLQTDNCKQNAPVEHVEKRIVHHHRPGNFNASSYLKGKLSRTVGDYNARPSPHVVSERIRDGTGGARDGTHKRLSWRVRGNIRADRRVECDLNNMSNLRETDNGFKRRRSTYSRHELEEGQKNLHGTADYLDHCSIKEKLELSSREVRKSDQYAAKDLTQIKYDSAVVTNVCEVKRRFSSKIVVPKMETEEPDCRDMSIANGKNLLCGDDQEERKNSKILPEDGQYDESQKATYIDQTTKKKLSTTREAQKSNGVDCKQRTRNADLAHGCESTVMHQQHLKLVAKIKRPSGEGSYKRDKINAKLCNMKERQTRQKLRDTKVKSKFQGKNDNRCGLGEKARALNKRSDGFNSMRPEGAISRNSPEICLSKVVKGGKEKTVKSKEFLLRSQVMKVVRKGDDGGQHLSSHESKHHKHRGRCLSVSPKLKNHTPQKKEHGKSMSSRRSEKDLSDWEKFERERNNTLASFDSRYRRFGGGTSGLGGYSPRRRRSEAAIKTPSPPPRSPERQKPRAWDLPPVGMDSSLVAAISAAHQAVAQQAAIQHAAAALASVTPHVSGSVFLSPGATSASCGLTPAPTMLPSILQQVNPAVTAVTLTQATRTLRRLYVGNVPATVSDGELLEFMNAAMLSANANHLPGTKPCINCSVNVDKSYAFAEFITPEDATAALAFDGVTLHGTTLKIRRPKDFAQPVNGGAENTSPIIDMVSSIVPDSPRKVFVGGISSSLSAEKVKEIVTAFGQLKAYHWEVDKTKQAYAFLEYMDPGATLKACAGLNGMKLGTKFLTVVQATPDASPEVTSTQTPSYGVPEHAKTLLQAPSRILELQNLVTEDELRLVSKEEIEEIKEDIRLECSRFGNIKSMHIVKFQSALEPRKEKGSFSINTKSCGKSVFAGNLTTGVNLEHAGVVFEHNKPSMPAFTVDGSRSENLRSSLAEDDKDEEIDENNQNTTPDLLSSGQTTNICCEERSCQLHCDIHGRENISKAPTHIALNGTEYLNSEGLHVLRTSRSEVDALRESVEHNIVGAKVDPIKEESDASPRDVDCWLVGKIYVEFSRVESACQAAHNLHGRTFAGRKITVRYFPLKTYQKKFHKGFRPRTYEEKQALALAVQSHLTAHIKD